MPEWLYQVLLTPGVIALWFGIFLMYGAFKGVRAEIVQRFYWLWEQHYQPIFVYRRGRIAFSFVIVVVVGAVMFFLRGYIYDAGYQLPYQLFRLIGTYYVDWYILGVLLEGAHRAGGGKVSLSGLDRLVSSVKAKVRNFKDKVKEGAAKGKAAPAKGKAAPAKGKPVAA